MCQKLTFLCVGNWNSIFNCLCSRSFSTRILKVVDINQQRLKCQYWLAQHHWQSLRVGWSPKKIDNSFRWQSLRINQDQPYWASKIYSWNQQRNSLLMIVKLCHNDWLISGLISGENYKRYLILIRELHMLTKLLKF